MTTITAARNRTEFLTVVPHLLGMVPRESLVLVPFRRGRSRGALRLDLPPDDSRLDEIAATMIGLVCRVPEADSCAIVVYAPGPAPQAQLITRLEHRADACGIRIADALWVDGDRWGAYEVPDAAPDAPTSGTLPSLVGVAALDQFSGTALPSIAPERAAAVAAALDSLGKTVTHLSSANTGPAPSASRLDPRALDALDALEDLPAFAEQLLQTDAATLGDLEIATLGWVLARPALRDIALIGWIDGIEAGDAAAAAQLAWERGAEYPPAIAMRLWGDGPTPDPERLARALELVRTVAASVPASQRPGALSVCAWVSWALGRSTHAHTYATEALRLDPEHGLSEIVVSLVQAVHLPDWAFRAASEV